MQQSFDDVRRQIRIALIAIVVILPVGIVGFMVLENRNFLDALWLTITTLTTIGYGDIVAKTEVGRIFTLMLIIFGLGTFAFAAQAAVALLVSPTLREIRQKRRAAKAISKLANHYIVCGSGELVTKTVDSLFESAQARKLHQETELYQPLDTVLDNLLGDDDEGNYVKLRKLIRQAYLACANLILRRQSILDVVVVVTTDHDYANELRDNGLLVIEGDPTQDETLRDAGIQRARAIMVLLESDTETLLTVLTAHNMNPALFITASTHNENLAPKMLRVGAHEAITPFDVAGQFMNSATLRPVVNDYFTKILFDYHSPYQITQLNMGEDSPWIGKRLRQLDLRNHFDAGVIGIRHDDGHFTYAPGEDYILHEGDIILAVAPAWRIRAIQKTARKGTKQQPNIITWQKLHTPFNPPTSDKTYSLLESEEAVQKLSQHFIIAGCGRLAMHTINKLDPKRPFVIVSNDNTHTSELLKRGFRVIHGNPTDENVLIKAGINRALAIMVIIEDQADAVLCVLTCRAMSKKLLISAIALTDEMIPKLERAGADEGRVVSPFRIAAQFVLLTTTRPDISDFMRYVLYNYTTGLETADLYIYEDSPWVGETIESLRLDRIFRAGVIGVRLADGETFIYGPPATHVIRPNEVLIAVVPMTHFDEMRRAAMGGREVRPTTLRRADVMKSHVWTAEEIEAIMSRN